MDGITTALIGYVFVCIVIPTMVKHKPQFYAGIAVVATTASAPFFRKTLRVMLMLISFGTRATQGSARR